MNTARKKIKIIGCTDCPDIFMTVGSQPVGLAERRDLRVSIDWETGEPCEGKCPKHKRSYDND